MFRYQELAIQTKWLDNVKSGYFNWIIFTSSGVRTIEGRHLGAESTQSKTRKA